MTLNDILIRDADQLIASSYEALEHWHLQHYGEDGTEVTRRRLTSLFELLLRAIAERNPDTVGAFAEEIGKERFRAGYDLFELQTAINTLEETLWRHIVEVMEPFEFAEALGLISTVLGLTKDGIGRTYVSLAKN